MNPARFVAALLLTDLEKTMNWKDYFFASLMHLSVLALLLHLLVEVLKVTSDWYCSDRLQPSQCRLLE